MTQVRKPFGSFSLAEDVVPAGGVLHVRQATMTFADTDIFLGEQVPAQHFPLFVAYHVITAFNSGAMSVGHNALSTAYASNITVNTINLNGFIRAGETFASAFLNLRDNNARNYRVVQSGSPTVGEVLVAIGFIQL